MKIWAILLTILLIGVCLRIYNLDGECIWSDEGFSIKLASTELSNIIDVTAKDVHPPLYYILLHYWIDLFGDSEFSTRMLSVIFGVIAIFVMYMLGSLIFEKKVGILGSLILSISVFHIRYSQEVRMYTLLTLLAILSVYFYVKLLENRRDLPTILGYIAATCLMMYTHCYGIFILVGQNVYYILLLFLKKANKPNTKCWIVLQTLVLILFTPWIFILINQISRVETMGFWIHEPSIINLIASFHIYSSKSPLLLLIYLLLILFPIWEISCRMRGSFYWKEHLLGARGILLLLVLIVTSNVLPFIVSKISTPVYLFRTTISASVAFYLLVAKGIKDLGHKLLEILTVTVIVLLSFSSIYKYYNQLGRYANILEREPWRDVAHNVDMNALYGDLAVCNGYMAAFNFNYYSRNPALKKQEFPKHSRNVTHENMGELEQTIGDFRRIWVIYCHRGKNWEWINKKISESHSLLYSKRYRSIELSLFEKKH